VGGVRKGRKRESVEEEERRRREGRRRGNREERGRQVSIGGSLSALTSVIRRSLWR